MSEAKVKRRHSGKFYLEVLALGLGGSLVAGVLLVWWLIQAPLRIDFVRPAVEKAIGRETGFATEIGHLSLAWQGMGSPLEIELDQVALHDQQGDTVFAFQSAALGIWLRYLVKGEVRPLSLVVIQPELTAARQPDGSFNFGFGDRSGGGKPYQQILADVFEPAPASSFATWEKLGIRNGRVVFLDEHAQPLGRITDVSVMLDRKPKTATAELTGQLQTDTIKVPISAKADYQAKPGKLSAHAELYDLPLSSLSGFSPLLASIGGVAVPAALNLDAAFDPQFTLDTAHLTIALGQGQIVLPDLFPAPAIPVSSGAIDLGYTANPRRIDLYGAGINLNGPVFDASAVATLSDDTWHFDLTGGFKDIPVDQLAALWPKRVAPGGYHWVTANLTGGNIADGFLHATGHAPQASPADFALDDLKGGFQVAGTTTHYFGELPVITDTSGEASFDQDSLSITLKDGHAGDLKLSGGTVAIDGFGDHVQNIKIDALLDGPVGTALDIVNHAPLFYAKKVKIDPATVTGTASTKLHLDFPLLSALPLARINLQADADLQGVTLPQRIGRHAIENLAGTLHVDTGKLTITGTATVETAPMDVIMLRNFNHQNGIDLDVGFKGMVNDAAQQKLGLSLPARYTGEVGVSGHYQDFGPAETIDLQLDLTKTVLKLDELAYIKPAGTPASGTMLIDLDQGSIHRIDKIRLEGKDLDVRGTADLDLETGQLRRLTLDRLQLGETDVAVAIQAKNDGGSAIDIKGRSLDVEKLINEKHAEGETSDTAPADQSLTTVNVDIGTLRTSPQSWVENVQGNMLLKGRSWQSADFSAMAGGHKLQFSYQPDPDEGEHLLVQTDDAGAFLAGLGLNNSMRGGQLKIEGQQPLDKSDGKRQPLQGHLDLEDFRLANTPVVARMLSLLSLTGFLESFSGQGIAFDSLTGDFTVGNTLLTISNGKLAGYALGLTIFGTGDRDAGTIDLHGIAVPFYSVNEFLNKIPLLGTMLTGGEGQGMFAASYSVTGTFDQPKVSINPLSVLTPGILRDLFFLGSQEKTPAKN